MTSLTLIWRNLWRNPLRTTLTAGSLAVSLFLFTMLMATVDSMHNVAVQSASALRLVVHHKTSMTKTLPLRHGIDIAKIPGVAKVCAMRWFGGRLDNSHEQFPSLAFDQDTFPIVFEDYAVGPDVFATWRAERTAAIVGAGLADRIGCHPGDRVSLRSTIPPYLRLDFRVVGITHAVQYPNVFSFRLDYLLESMRANGMMPASYNDAVQIYWVRCASNEAMDAVRPAIDGFFARTSDATITEPEEAFVAQFTKMFGDIPSIVRNVGLIVITSILLVLSNTMSGAVRERIAELAVLKALGYTTSRLIMLLLGEAALMGMIGAAGCIVAGFAFRLTSAAGLSMPYFPTITVSPAVVAAGIGVSILINLAAVALPARRVATLSVTSALRDLG